jgi:hypothetical protein
MPYAHYNTDERNALQAMEGMGLPKSDMAAIPGKHPGNVYRELNRNGDCGVYTGGGARTLSAQRRLDSMPSPKLGSPAPTGEIIRLFKEDLSPDRISGRFGVLYSASTCKILTDTGGFSSGRISGCAGNRALRGFRRLRGRLPPAVAPPLQSLAHFDAPQGVDNP